MHAWRRPKWAVSALCLAAVLAAIASWALWPSSSPPPRERQYRATTACLLTDDKGLVGEQAQATWKGMQAASVATLVKVQYLSVPGPQTPANAAAYFNSLALQKCALIFATGEAPIAAMLDGYSRFPELRYVAVGGANEDPQVTVVPATPLDTVPTTVQRIISEAA
ncbi:hypothetical protein [Micromonospora chokoriensis]|uniref:hypothetical protein n=1 Tax=Micromonospora chokoriensis TaxID=356851 RepID=UPI0012F9C8E4|nr:hypothetical protein [Micromonospora chokoriensis]